MLVCACFIVNYVTADSKTNWAEGLAMVAFYVIIVSYSNIAARSPSQRFFEGGLCMALPRPAIDRNHASC